MEKNEIIENHKLIAEFMGYEYISYDPASELKAGWWKKGITKEQQVREATFRKIGKTKFLCRRHPELRYYNSWDWLMPVIEKIEKLGYAVKITSKYCSIARNHTYKNPLIISEFTDSKIKKVYDIVIGFIKYYNRL